MKIDSIFVCFQYVQKGAVLATIDGDIELANVTFAYPARPDRLIFKSFNIKIPAGMIEHISNLLFFF